MDRREAVKSVAILMGGVLSASTLSIMLDSCNHEFKSGEGTSFTENEKKIISGIAGIIIPRTDTPGAVDAGVPEFIVMMMQECHPEKDQEKFHEGLSGFDKQCKEKYGKPFLKLDEEKQETVVQSLDEEVLGNKKKKSEFRSFYHNMKALTLLGFFTSEPGATKTLRYVQVPGRYDGCVPYHEGDKAWAT